MRSAFHWQVLASLCPPHSPWHHPRSVCAAGKQVLAIWRELQAVTCCWELQVLHQLNAPPAPAHAASSDASLSCLFAQRVLRHIELTYAAAAAVPRHKTGGMELPCLAAEQPWTEPVCMAYLNSSSLRRLFFFLSDSHCGRLFPAETLYTCRAAGRVSCGGCKTLM